VPRNRRSARIPTICPFAAVYGVDTPADIALISATEGVANRDALAAADFFK